MEWKSILTAPRSGKRILVGYGRQSGFPVKVVFYNVVHQFWSHYGVPEWGLEANATHWCEITPPIAGTQTDEPSALESSANNEVVNK